MTTTIRFALLLSVCVWSGCYVGHSDGDDSSTNWLSCERDAQCAAGSCADGVCVDSIGNPIRADVPSLASEPSTESQPSEGSLDGSRERAASDSAGSAGAMAQEHAQNVSSFEGPWQAPAGGCDGPPVGRLSLPGLDGFRGHLLGAWLLCSSPSVFGTDERGIVITADGRWAKLVANDAGELVRAVGWGHEGSYETLDTSDFNLTPTFQLNLLIDGQGTVITTPVFTNEPDIMGLSNIGVFDATYQRL